MIKQVNSSLYASTSPQARRKTRTRASASSSVSSYDPPKAPLDTYSGVRRGELGDTFCVLKMKGASCKKRKSFYSVSHMDGISSSPYCEIAPMVVQTESLPDWLSTTLLNLPLRDPLRILLPMPLPLTHPPQAEDCQFFDSAPMFSDQTEPTLVEPNLDDAYSIAVDHTTETLVPNGAGTHIALPEKWSKTNTGSVHKSLPWNNPATNWRFPKMINDDLGYDKSLEAALLVQPKLSTVTSPLPFSTPDPSSAVTLNYPHHSTSSTLKPFNNDIDPLLPASVNGPLMQSALEESIPSSDIYSPSPRFAFLPISPQHDAHVTRGCSIDSPSPSLRNSGRRDSLPITHAPDRQISPTIREIVKFPCVAQPVFASDQTFSHVNRSNFQNPYATPGPRYQVPVSQAIYFDFPTDDLSELDPLEGYEALAMDELDFKWEPYFTAKGYSSQNFVHSKSSVSEIPLEGELGVEDRGLYPDASSSDGSLHQMSSDKSLKFRAIQSHSSNDYGENEEDPVVNTQPGEVAFAPAPGIYISPLRNESPCPELRQDSGLFESRPLTSLPCTPKRQVGRASTNFIRSTREDPNLGRTEHRTISISPICGSTPIVSRIVGATSRGVYASSGWRVARETGVTASKPADNEDRMLGTNSLSQVSNDSIESWAEV